MKTTFIWNYFENIKSGMRVCINAVNVRKAFNDAVFRVFEQFVNSFVIIDKTGVQSYI
ncbi:hypothetical protein D3C81_851730 [compost metagenome]